MVPVLLYGGLVSLAAILLATGKKRSLEIDTLKVLKTENAAKVLESAGRFDAANDDETGALLRVLADRMSAHKAGNNSGIVPAPSFDPDNSGEPAVAEWTGTLLTSSFSDAQLIRWADAYEALNLPGAAKLIRDKAAEDDTPKEEAPASSELPADIQKQVSDLLAAHDDPFAMDTLAKTLDSLGRPDISAELRKQATSIRAQWAEDEREAEENGDTYKDVGVKVTPGGNVVPVPKEQPSAPSTNLPNELPQATLDSIAKALASGDAELMLKLADGLDNVGASVPAAQLRARALEIKAATPAPKPPAAKPAPAPAPKPAPALPAKPPVVVVAPAPKPAAPVVVAPKPAPALPAPKPAAPVAVPAVHVVANGESPWMIATKYTGNGARYKELFSANPKLPLNADKSNFKSFFSGLKLNLPASWKAPTATAATKYDVALKANADVKNVANLKAFQTQEGLVVDGLYGPKSGLRIAAYGIVPAKPLVWSRTTGPADKKAWTLKMNEYATKDAPRAAQWTAAGKV